MNILFVTHYYPPGEGEAAVRTERLARHLTAQGHQVTVLTTMPHYPQGRIADDYRGKLYRVQERDGVRVIYAWLLATDSPRISRKLLSQLSYMVMALLRGLRLEAPDVTFIEAQPIFTGVAGRLISRIKGAPYVLNVSDLWPDHLLTVGALDADDMVYKIARTVMDSGYRGAAGITTMSPGWSEKIIQRYLPDASQHAKVHTILRGVDTDQFRPFDDPLAETRAFRDKYNLSDKKLVTFIGTFATQYDFPLIMDAVATVSAREDVQCVFIGTGSQRDYVESRLSELPDARFIDWLAHDEMPAAWNASAVNFWALRDVDLYRGTIPAKLFEALACGTPVAAAQGGWGAEILSESGGGIATPPGDTQALIDALTRLLDDDTLRQQCRQQGRTYALNEFSFEAAMQSYADVLIDAAER